jgi:hypothetical protein
MVLRNTAYLLAGFVLGCGSLIDETPQDNASETGGSAGGAGTAMPSGPGTGGTTTPGTGGASATGGSTWVDGSASVPIGDGSVSGAGTILIGATMEDATAGSAPFDVRYVYLAGGALADTPCTSCASCNASWWGCWQGTRETPGRYVTNLIDACEGATWQSSARPQIPAFTYYQFLHASGATEGDGEVSAFNDAAIVGRYLNDFRFLLQTIGLHVAIVHVEPDLWGYVRNRSGDPTTVPAKVREANPTDCADAEQSAAGLATCMIAMTRTYAPNAKIGLHVSPWTGMNNASTRFNMANETSKAAAFMKGLGANKGDYLVTDPSDRDAAYYEIIKKENRWWDATNATLPNFTQAFAWTKGVAEQVGRPMIQWQVPVGNMAQGNTDTHWKDNRLDYFFAHMDEVAASHTVMLLFGSGMDGMTTPETDGGNLVAKTIAYRTAGGTPIQ